MLSVHFGPFASSLDRAILLFAILVTVVVGALLGRRRQVAASSAALNVLLIGLVAARLGFIVRYFDAYRHDWLGMLDIRDGGFDPVSGVVVGSLVAIWMLWRSPALRKPLGIALLSGAATWAVTAGLITLMDRQSRGLPQVELRTMTGETVTLSSVATPGKPMVVNLWATWCPPCRREMPMLAAAQQQYSDVTFVFVNQGEDREEIRHFLDQGALTLDHVLLDARGTLGQAVGSRALPTTLFYHPDGRLVDTHLGELSRATLARGLERTRP